MDTLREWFLQNQRSFPWRESPNPYRVWISEVMLQQTQSARVIGFYERWMALFPDIQALAKARLEEVLKCWEGLGYYARARSLHAAAQDIVKRFGGQIPSDPEQLISIKGLGPYTVGAILAFGFQKKAAAVDGNVTRVLTRFFEIEDDIGRPATQKNLRELAFDLLPEKEPHIITEALIELGATICRPKPTCTLCPLRKGCKSFKNESVMKYPVKKNSTIYEKLYREVAIISCDDHFLVRQGPSGIACTGLYEFPYFDAPVAGVPFEALQQMLQDEYGLQTLFQAHLDEETHSFTRFRVKLYPKLFSTPSKKKLAGLEWHTLEKLKELTFSSGHKRLLDALSSYLT